MMKWARHLIALVVAFSSSSWAASALVDEVKAERNEMQAQQVQREAKFASQEQQLRELKQQLAEKKRHLTEQNARLREAFTNNEKNLSQLEQKLALESSSLGEVFGVVRQHAKELNSELEGSISGVGQADVISDLARIINANSLPNLEQFTQLWHGLEQQIEQSGLLQTVAIDTVENDGVIGVKRAQKLGSVALIGEGGFLEWNSQLEQARTLTVQPKGSATLSDLNNSAASEFITIALDPTRGQLLNQLSLQPTVVDRIKAGGIVGTIILVLLAIGLVIALARGVVLFTIHRQVHAQLKCPENPQNNPLGRVLAIYDAEPNRTVEALELRLLEAILDEQSKLEKGLSMLKLLAALAPMLGLLGTVTGMIETFQVITLFGSGDAKVMAGGISMALVTTVMGLVAAMPLLLAHNILSTQAENLRNVLEKQGVALVATKAESALGIETSDTL